VATLYLVFGFSAFTSSFMVKKLGAKSSLFWGSTTYSFWILCFLLPSYYPENKDSGSFLFNRTFIIIFTLVSSATAGFGGGILWVAQGKYMSECATDENKGFFLWTFLGILHGLLNNCKPHFSIDSKREFSKHFVNCYGNSCIFRSLNFSFLNKALES